MSNGGDLGGTVDWIESSESSPTLKTSSAPEARAQKRLSLRVGAVDCSLQSRRLELAPEAQRRAEHFDRLAADLELYNRIKFAQYEGRDYEVFRDALAAYALPVLVGWCRSGRIFVECARKGRRVAPLPIPPETSGDIAADTIVEALARFREDVLIPHRWDAGRGASLRTYFVGNCVLAFPNIYRLWQRGESANVLSAASLLEPHAMARPTFREPDFWLELEQAVQAVGDDAALTLLGKIEGYTNKELAADLGISTKAVEARLHKLRRR